MEYLMVTADDAPGLVARVFEAAAAARVDVGSLFVLANGATGLVTVGAEDGPALRAALSRGRLRYIPLAVVEIEIADDAPARAELFRRLADAGVDLRLAVPAGRTERGQRYAIAARDHDLLKRVLEG